MSLFSSRQWWHTRLGSEEEFDQGSLCVANIDNDPSGSVKLVTGSLQGVLRVHQPHQQGFHIEDSLLEAQLDSGILQLAAGNFQGGSALCLAVLHPKKLSVYTIQAMGSSFLNLVKAYEHSLVHTAANLAYGPFGGDQGMDHIVVQSYDGQLTFFEHKVQSFSRVLPDFLLPGPLTYLVASDSFMTTTAGLELVSYRYSSIAALDCSSQHTGGKQLLEDWRVVLGEAALDVQAGSMSTAADSTDTQATPSILVLAEHTFFILDLQGHILVQRRLDHHPSCFWTFPATAAAAPATSPTSSRGPAASFQADNLLIATHTKALQVYKGQQLAWAAQLELLPVAVRVTSIGGVRGMIVALDDAGNLSVLYLGTQPPQQLVAFSSSQNLDYAAMEEERTNLLSQLRAAGGTAGLEAAMAAKAEAKSAVTCAALVLKAKVPAQLDRAENSSISGSFAAGMGGPASGNSQQQLTVTLLLTNTTKSPLKDVAISVLVPAPLEAAEAQASIPQLPPSHKGSTPTAVQVVLTNAGNSLNMPCGLPASNTLQVIVTFTAGDGQVGVLQLDVCLPMCIFCQVVPPVKNADLKLTVSTNREAVQVMEVFADMVMQANPAHADALKCSQAANILSFRYSDGQDVSILVSKNGGRYRLQAGSLGAMWIVLQELHQRLSAHFAAQDRKLARAGAESGGMQDVSGEVGTTPLEVPFQMTFNEALPLQGIFDLIQKHFAARTAVDSIDAQLEQQEVTFRSIQRRLLARYQDKNAAPLNQLDVLMEETHDHIIGLADQLQAAQDQLAAAGLHLSAGVQLLLFLCKLHFNMSSEAAHVLSSCLSPVVHEDHEVGWEEVTEAAMTQSLRSCLAKSQKDTAVVPALATAQDTTRVQRHISLVIERLKKGMTLFGSSNAP